MIEAPEEGGEVRGEERAREEDGGALPAGEGAQGGERGAAAEGEEDDGGDGQPAEADDERVRGAGVAGEGARDGEGGAGEGDEEGGASRLVVGIARDGAGLLSAVLSAASGIMRWS